MLARTLRTSAGRVAGPRGAAWEDGLGTAWSVAGALLASGPVSPPGALLSSSPASPPEGPSEGAMGAEDARGAWVLDFFFFFFFVVVVVVVVVVVAAGEAHIHEVNSRVYRRWAQKHPGTKSGKQEETPSPEEAGSVCVCGRSSSIYIYH